MDEELKIYLEGMKHDFQHDLEGLKRDFQHDLEGMKHELRDHTEAVETRLLREFWKWARTADARYRQHHGEFSGLSDRVDIIEDRVAELERRDDRP